MRFFSHYFSGLIIFVAISSNVLAQQTTNTMWTQKNAEKWVKSKVWSNGRPLTIHPSTNNVEFARQYEKNKGRKLKVVLKDREIVLGLLKEVVEEKIILETENKEGKKIEMKMMDIPFAEIEKAFVTVSFK